LFKNLYFLRDPTFRDHNFSDFWNSPGGGGGDPVEQVSDVEIEKYIRRSYLPNSVRPAVAEGFPPDFNPILPITLSQPCCESFIRAYPTLPVTPRDYYLSKAFQFAFSAVVIHYFPDAAILTDPMAVPPSFTIAESLASSLDIIQERHLAAICEPELRWWWDLYDDTTRLDLEKVLKRFRTRLRRMASHKDTTHDEPTTTVDTEAFIRVKRSVPARIAAAYLELSLRQLLNLERAGKLDTEGQGHHKKYTTESLRRYKGTS
jgi:hypothetical protein